MVFSCNTKSKLPTKQDLASEIDSLEYQIYQSGEQLLDNRKPQRLIGVYRDYAKQFPMDSLAAKYWFKAAQIQVNLGESMEAIKTLDSLIINYPDNKLIPSALQFKAFIYDDRLGKIDEARAALDELINKFPESELVENAKAYKETLGKSPEEIIVEMEAKAKALKEKESE
jgi:TolA-binding protein